MRNNIKSIKIGARTIFLGATIASGISLSVWLIGCSSPKPAQQASQSTQQGPHRYSLKGRVVSVEAAKQQVTVDAEDIPGFMPAMAMGYQVKDTNLLKPLSPEDQITADVVVNGDDNWLENIVVVKKAGQAKTPASPEPKKQ
jgi:Cu/Ag efflux protein CusF